MVVGRKVKLPSLLIFSSVNRKVGLRASTCARSGTPQKWLKSCYLVRRYNELDTLLLLYTLYSLVHVYVLS